MSNMENNKTEIKVGLTVLVGIIAFLFILGWTKNLSLFNHNKILKVKFGNVAGLAKGDPVMINGVRKGFIKNIDLIGDSVLTTITLDKNAKLFADASFSIMMLDLMGGKKIEISAGHSGIPLDFNKIYAGKFAGDISTAVAALGAVQSDVTSIIKQLKVTLNHLNGLLEGDTLKRKLQNTLSSINKTAKNANVFIESNNILLNKFIANSNNLVLTINSLIKQNRKQFGSLIRNGNQFIVSARTLADSLNSFTQEVRARKNNIGEIIYNKNYIVKLKSALNRLNKLIDILIKQLNSSGLNVDIF